MLEGDSFLYRVALGILAVLEPRLFFPDRKELLELLQCVISCSPAPLYSVFLIPWPMDAFNQGRKQGGT